MIQLAATFFVGMISINVHDAVICNMRANNNYACPQNTFILALTSAPASTSALATSALP